MSTATISVLTVLPRKAFGWKECGCVCESCVNNNSIHLHHEIEVLKRQLRDRDYHIVQMETTVMNEASSFPDQQMLNLQDELRFWQDKYNRLYESHKKLQKVNQGLEDKLLKIVDKYETEKSSLTKELTDVTSKLVSAELMVAELEEENEQYRNDCNVAVHLLQCKPSNFVSHKFNSLPCDLQEKVRVHLSQRALRHSTRHKTDQQQSSLTNNQNSPPEPKIIRVPIATFPPTAMVYSINKTPPPINGKKLANENGSSNATQNSPDLVSAAIMAKVLAERAKERSLAAKNCTCQKRWRNTDSANNIAHKSTQVGMPCVHQFRERSESSSSADSNFRVRHGSVTSTETII